MGTKSPVVRHGYWLLARLVWLVHVGFLIFLFLGGLLFARWPWTAGAHLLALVYAITISVLVLPCPLTKLEKHLDARAGVTPYADDCVAHYLWSKLPVDGDEPWLLAILLLIALLFNANAYVGLF